MDIDPRRSLVARIIWLVVALASSFAVAASLWAGSVAREIVVQQHMRRLALETDQLASDLSQAAAMRLAGMRAMENEGPPAEVFKRLVAVYPDLGWIAVADAGGTLIEPHHADANVSGAIWFSSALHGPWLGAIDEIGDRGEVPLLGDMAAPLRDPSGNIVGVIAAHLNWRWASSDVERLSDTSDARGSAQTLVLNRDGLVVVGPHELRNKPWNGAAAGRAPPEAKRLTPRFEHLPDGREVLVARAPVQLAGVAAGDAWQVQLSEPKEIVYLRANALAWRIVWISVSLGVLTALLGAWLARQLTNRLKRLTLSAGAVGRNEIGRIEVPGGQDEVAQLGRAFAKVLDDLNQERSELERRVAVRTREVERLAEESRYAAVVRERLQIARDLHDTLAHSMMAMLSEIRLLRKLHTRDPGSLAAELARAEEVAHAGLSESRNAIAQMRAATVRETGLGPALARAIDRFEDRTGLEVEFSADTVAARLADDRAEVIFRMTEEALRNIERHAVASRVRVVLRSADAAHLELQIEDDGVGFDPAELRPGHFGLIGLREQAQLIGARLDIKSSSDEGTILTLALRIAPEAL